MVSRVFGLAGIAVLAGAVMAVGAAGCSNEDDGATATDVDAGTTDAGRDRFVPDDGDDDDEPAESCASKDPVDVTTVPYAKALRSPGACSTAEVATLSSYYDLNASTLSVAGWAASVSEACAACAFTASDAEAWGPLLVEGDSFVGANRGGCLEIASEKETCGRAYEQALRCMLVACLPTSQGGVGTCRTQAEFDACRSDRAGLLAGPCADAFASLQKECGAALNSYERACTPSGAKYVFQGTIPAHCGGTAPEGDGDAGAADGG
ncbi:MAG: hypothetical protein KF764_35290 [Labilithrix sp.]|nr:hypothetical protein [Labilithrix sp.]MBX3220499.1 hypothetical protein [Labilithrix sp.]